MKDNLDDFLKLDKETKLEAEKSERQKQKLIDDLEKEDYRNEIISSVSKKSNKIGFFQRLIYLLTKK